MPNAFNLGKLYELLRTLAVPRRTSQSLAESCYAAGDHSRAPFTCLVTADFANPSPLPDVNAWLGVGHGRTVPRVGGDICLGIPPMLSGDPIGSAVTRESDGPHGRSGRSRSRSTTGTASDTAIMRNGCSATMRRWTQCNERCSLRTPAHSRITSTARVGR